MSERHRGLKNRIRRNRALYSRFKLAALTVFISGLALLAVSAPTLALSNSNQQTSCSPHQLALSSWASESTVNSSRAVGIAWQSVISAAKGGDFGNLSNLSFGGTTFDWLDNTLICAVQLEEVNITFDAMISGTWTEITVMLNPSVNSVLNISLQALPQVPVTHGTALWTGWEVSTTNLGYGNPDVYGEWIVPYENWPSWGCTWVPIFYTCQISPWVGLTNLQGGGSGGSGTGIAQVGTDTTIQCLGQNYLCSRSFLAWIEFYPALPQSSMEVFPGDTMFGEAYYTTQSQYEVFVEDVTTAHSMSATQSMSMGAPNWGNYIAENSWDNYGGTFQSPSFGQVNFGAMCISGTCDLVGTPHYNFGPGNHIATPSQSDFYYYGSACVIDVYTCFNLYQD